MAVSRDWLRRVTCALVTACLAAAVSTSVVSAASKPSGRLDPAFGSGGKVTTFFNGGAFAIAVQSNTRLVVAGASTSGPNTDFALARYRSNGSLDTSFGAGGRVLTDFGGTFDQSAAVAVQSDGKIVAAGVSNSVDANFDFAVGRYNTDGSLDTTFGAGGKVLTDFGGTAPNTGDFAFALAIQSDGKIVVAGSSNANPGTIDFALARYNTDGTLDNGFGTYGLVLTELGGFDGVSALAIQSNGMIVAAGSSVNPGLSDFALARYNTDGTLDTTFGAGGKVLTDFGVGDDSDAATSVAIQSDGKIVAAGVSDANVNNSSPNFDFALARYNTSGSLDTNFGTGGKVVTGFGGTAATDGDVANGVAIQSDGKIVAAGRSEATGGGDFALARYNSDGSLDTSFGTAGKVVTDFFGGPDSAQAVVIQVDAGNDDGKIVAAGSSDGNKFALARYNK